MLVVAWLTLGTASGLQSQTPAPQPAEVQVGGRLLKIPAPEGFVRCDAYNPEWDKAMASVLPPTNRMLATFGTAADLDRIRQGKPTEYRRNFHIQATRSLESTEIGERTFGDMRKGVKKELVAMRANLESEMKKLVDQGNKHLSEEYGVDAALSISDTAMLGFFEETDTSIGFSLVMKVNLAKDGEKDESRSITACLMTPINGRLVNLYSAAPYRSEADQQEVEKTVQAWRDAIVAVNPKVEGPAGGFDWNQVLRSAVIGAGIGLLFGIFQWLSKKFRQPKAP